MGDTCLTCNPIGLDVEAIGGFNGTDYVEHAFAVTDRGANHCGCTADEACVARSTNLRPTTRAATPEP